MSSSDDGDLIHRQGKEQDQLQPGILTTARDRALTPLRYAVSKPARRTYLSLSLFLLTSSILLCTAILAYLAFYFSYVPNKGFSRPVYFQYDYPETCAVGDGLEGGCIIVKRTWAEVDIKDKLIGGLAYDVSVVLHMPRSSTNKEAGNFMVEVQLLGPRFAAAVLEAGEGDVLVKSRRPAILTYHSGVMEMARNAVGFPLHLLGFRREDEMVRVGVIEGVQFEKGWRSVPTRAMVTIESERVLQIYSAKLNVRAKLQGLRWVMYNWRLLSAVTLTFAFWSIEMGVAAAIYGVMLWISSGSADREAESKREDYGPKEKGKLAIRGEEEQRFSDTERFYPSPGGREHPMRYTPPVKEEDAKVKLEPQESVPPAGVEADDEDEDADFLMEDVGMRGFDSGLGTSMDSGAATGRGSSVRRRRSGPLKPEVD